MSAVRLGEVKGKVLGRRTLVGMKAGHDVGLLGQDGGIAGDGLYPGLERGREIVEHRPEWVIPEDEAWGRDEDGRQEPFYVVRFRQRDLWPNYTGLDVDTLETEMSERWLEPASEDNE